MKIINDNESLKDFKAWSGAIKTVEKIVDERKSEEFEQLIDELYPDGLTETQLNDILWFDSDWVFEQLGIEEEESE